MKLTIDRIIGIILIVILLGTSLFFGFKAEHLEEELERNLDYQIRNPEANGYISEEEALAKVLTSLNITRNDIYDLDIDLDFKFNLTVYNIDFTYNRYEYDYYLDARTGEIVKSFQERD